MLNARKRRNPLFCIILKNGVQYSSENLKKVIAKNSTLNAKELTNRIKDDLKKYVGIAQQYDDQSVLVVKIQ